MAWVTKSSSGLGSGPEFESEGSLGREGTTAALRRIVEEHSTPAEPGDQPAIKKHDLSIASRAAPFSGGVSCARASSFLAKTP
jgi:hypothetical protein